ncbi:type III-B CRISPR-associated protein Cas10/Cmr2 [Tepiditoga spiralis]|uniref:Type III-B CRISPR-associated protein Cas10/Cmr2 n=1 Tax=Tepiditoga spiralis TaxID=2108365 RepID=A0A7G1G3I1_9BACT|nr:type III-B CRISPR-associated protein Cas10/Cmr2 [Tepiditoga spiralis]BBE30575.1 type III-B CRISPR-associated protein Cas10/Cmr2 [Tepiditoga spiralis]
MAIKFWHRKINALLHDPVEKVYTIKTHEALQNKRISELNITPNKPKADVIASSIERIPLPNEQTNSDKQRVYVNSNEFYIIHPLTGEKVSKDILDKQLNKKDILSQSNKFYEDIKKYIEKEKLDVNDVKSAKKLYNYIWWYLPKSVEQSYLLPADTRVPDVSIIDHLDTTAAFSSVTTENYSIVMISIGPVQDFIAAGRKISDLRNGSYLLSYLTYQGIKYVGQNYGYDCIIFPSMRDNYFVAKDLGFYTKELEIDPAVASLPNVFSFIIPKSDVELVINKIKEWILLERDNIINFFLEKINNNTLNELKSNVSFELITEHGLSKEQITKEFKKQVKQFPTIVATVQNLENFNSLNMQYKDYTGIDLTPLKESFEKLENTYTVKDYQYYSYNSELLGIKSGIRKTTRDFIGYIEQNSNPGDEISGNEKALIKEITIYDDEEKTENISAITLIKRYLPNYLEKETLYEEASKSLKNTKKNTKDDITEISKDYNASILMMDGDKMGEWISGKKAPVLYQRLHKNAISRLERIDKKYLEKLEELQFITPSYQRTISRTLNEFSKLVPKIINNYKGTLIYAGGDDVLAILPSNKLAQAANDIRKAYSGVDNLELENLKFNKGYMYKDGKMISNMMGHRATMSAGLLTFNPSYNLKLALNKARELEKIAKSNYEVEMDKDNKQKKVDRDSFAISSIRGSGKIKIAKSKWDINIVPKKDIIETANSLISKLEENKKSEQAFISKLKYEYESLCFSNNKRILKDEEFIKKVVPFIIKERMNLGNLIEPTKKILNLCKNKNLELKDILDILEELEYSAKKPKRGGE